MHKRTKPADESELPGLAAFMEDPATVFKLWALGASVDEFSLWLLLHASESHEADFATVTLQSWFRDRLRGRGAPSLGAGRGQPVNILCSR